MGTWPWFVATAGGLGHMWPASGTWGSLPPVALFALMAWMHSPAWLQVVVQLLLGVAACAGCLHHGGKVESIVGRKDPGVVVVDEVAGMAFTLVLSVLGVVMFGAPSADRFGALLVAMPPSLALMTAAGSFFWFRVMDVIKLPPARRLQSLPGGLGVLIDDVVVAPYAAIALVASLELWVRLQPVSG
jgi:phosphatidylglycerophosphatase A